MKIFDEIKKELENKKKFCIECGVRIKYNPYLGSGKEYADGWRCNECASKKTK